MPKDIDQNLQRVGEKEKPENGFLKLTENILYILKQNGRKMIFIAFVKESELDCCEPALF